MKRFILLLAAGCAILSAKAQQPDVAQVLVHYKFTHVRDTTNRDKPYKEDMGLWVGKNAGLYKSNEEHRSSSHYYQFVHEKKMARKESLFIANYQVNDELPVIKWKITSDTATFGGLHCQKATAHFKGRDYTAWFCPGLALSVGPWKLNGLPGVIIEASDAKKEVSFIFDGIEKLDPSSTKAVTVNKVPENLTPITESDFNKLQETFRKDPDAFIKMVTGAGDGSGRQMKVDIKPGSPQILNNPIELAEKK